MLTFSQWFLFSYEINSFLSWWATFFLFYKWPTFFFFFSLLPMPHKSFLSFSPSSLPISLLPLPFLLFPSSLPLLLPSPPSLYPRLPPSLPSFQGLTYPWLAGTLFEEEDLGFLILLLLPLEYWDHRHLLPCLVLFMVLWILGLSA